MDNNVEKKELEIKQFEETVREYGALVTVDKRGGNPENYFELSYKVPGYIPGSDGKPVVSELHRVSIHLPMGYPATCPLVKPITPLFHPQVGKDAYVVAMHWQEIGSLSELVIYIGKMICGEVFNAESTINPKAAAWFKNNPQKIKLGAFTPGRAISSEVLALLDEIVPDHSVDLSEKKNETSREVAAEERPSENEFSGETTEDIDADTGDMEYQAPPPDYVEVTFPEENENSPRKSPPIKLIAGVLCGVLVVGVLLVYLHDRNIIKNSEEIWFNAKRSIENGKYDEALKEAGKAKDNLSDVYLIAGKSEELALEIDKALASNAFVEGLHGAKREKGQGVEASKVRELETLIAQAQSLKDEGKVVDSRKKYEEALLFAVDKGLETYSDKLRWQIDELHIEETLLEAKHAEEVNNWDDAARIYKAALKIGRSSAETGSEGKHQMLIKYLTVIKNRVEQLKQSAEEQHLQKTVAILSDAEILIGENPNILQESEKWEFERLLASSQINLVLHEGKQAYEKEAWDTAIEKYDKALLLIKFKNQYVSDKFQGAEKIIAKTLLTTKVAKELSLASESESRNNPSAALEHYNGVIQLLKGEPLAQEKDFQIAIDNAQSQIARIERQRMIMRKITWLKENYAVIFKKHYPAINESYLFKPEVTLIKDEPDKLVFHLSCVDQSQGRSARLVLDYVNILKTNKWDLYFEKK
ncbi:MAG: hypothetical protein OEV64_04640 [Desulfobulbaceae bacterium]|nr:hypothetical protein [Desulfobulbaceae bacterium]